MARAVIQQIRFRPPVAVARVGDSDTPLEAFSWVEDPRIFGAAKTIIHPATSLEVLPDGSVEPYRPNLIRFKDGQGIRPVCPFLELEATLDGQNFRPLTPQLLESAGIDLSQLHFRVTAANLKAKRRTGDRSCAFEARLEVRANDHRRHDLQAWSRASDPNPLVLPQRPVWLGAFQVIRPVPRKKKFDVSTDTIRARFTPGHGAVYGPPSAVSGQAMGSRTTHQVVPEANRILNPDSSWCRYSFHQPVYPMTLPFDIYDGADDVQRDDRSFGVVDDSCDAIITASLSTFFSKLLANARIVVSPPHFSPDRRHLYSFAEDLADRQPDSVKLSPADFGQLSVEEWLDAVSDLFRRIWETASQINLERHRDLNLTFNNSQDTLPGFPLIDQGSMTRIDAVGGHLLMSDRFISLADQDAGDGINNVPLLPKAEFGRIRHSELTIPEVLLEFMVEHPGRFKRLLRRPFRRMSDAPADQNNPDDFRDPRFPRSHDYDARMPPFLRDCDFAPLSVTRRQWDLLFAQNENGSLMKQAYEALKK